MGVRPLVIDARARTAFSTVQLPCLQDPATTVVDAVAGRLDVKEVMDAAKGMTTAVGLDRVLVIDGVHLLSRNPLVKLEALAKVLAFYPEYLGWKLIVPASEGWMMAGNLWDRVEGYAARIYTVKPIGETYARFLYKEYSGKPARSSPRSSGPREPLSRTGRIWLQAYAPPQPYHRSRCRGQYANHSRYHRSLRPR